MKRNLFVFIFLCTCFSLRAQIQHGKDDDKFRLIDAGPVIGFNASQVDGDLYAGFYKFGINAGAAANINFNQQWSLGFEILFSQKGAHSNFSENNTNDVYNLTLNYAEIPVMINYKDQNRMIFSAGLAYGRLLEYKLIYNGSVIRNDDAYYNDELSYHIGGTLLTGENKHFGINLRYQGSITAIGVASPNSRLAGAINRLISVRGIYYF